MTRTDTGPRPPHIFHVTDNHSPAHPGVTAVITQISRGLAAASWPVTILAAGPAGAPPPPGVTLRAFPLARLAGPWRYPRGLTDYLDRLAADPGVVLHLHGVWGAPMWLAARLAARRGLPALLSPHDMLSPWHWRHGRLRRLKKLIYWRLLAAPAFAGVSAVHAITPREARQLAGQFPGTRLEVIPNAVDLAAADAGLAAADAAPPGPQPYVLFLARLHPKKGIDLLLEAFARARGGRNFELVIVGPDDSPAYTRSLRALAAARGLTHRVRFPGPVFGPEKWALYKHAWAFCLPSRSEVVGIVNLEAAAAGVPVVTTHETGLEDWEEGGGLLIHPRVAELQAALEQVFSWSPAERTARGRELRRLVAARYSTAAVGPRWLQLYQSLT